MQAEARQGTDETLIRALIEAHAQGIRTKNAAAVVATYAPDTVMYDLAPPLQHTPANSPGRRGIEEWFATWQGAIGYAPRDPTVIVGDGVAYAFSLVRMSGRKVDGEQPDMWFRETLCFRKQGGAWLIAHQHQSVPFLMDGSFKAAVDLQP